MTIETASVSDLEEILAIQKLAYISEAMIYNDYNISPLLQTPEDVKEEYRCKTILKAVDTGKIVGSVRAYAQDGTCYIGKLIVHPDYQNRGIGTKLMKEIEARFDFCNRYELFTGHKSEKNIYLYKKLGYKIFKEEKMTDSLNFVYLEKYVNALGVLINVKTCKKQE